MNILEIGALLATLVGFAILYYLDNKKHLHFGLLILLGTLFGVIIGAIFKTNYKLAVSFGTIYVHMVFALVIPMLFFSIVSSITNLAKTASVKKVGIKSVFFLLLNNFTASSMALAAGLIFALGKGFAYGTIGEYTPREIPSFLDTIINLFPNNIFQNMANGEVVPVVIFAVLVAIAYNVVKNEHEDIVIFKKFIDAGNHVMGQAISILIDFTPYAVLSLFVRAVGRANITDLVPLLTVMIVAYALCAIQLFGVESLLIKIFAGLSPLPFLKKIFPAMVVAFTSQSSIGTLPVTISSLKKMGVDGDVAGFTAGLGANLGMPGCAGIWPILSAIFAINVLHIPYTPTQYLFLIVLTLVVSVGTVGVPGTATISTTAVFAAAGLPIEIIVLLTPISSIVDMARTATNVVAAAEASLVVAKQENLLDEEAYYAVEEKSSSKSSLNLAK